MPVDGEILEAPEMDAAEPEAIDAESEAAEQVEGEAEQTEQEASAEPVDGDGRVIPAKFKEIFKTEGVGKELKAQFFENREFKSVFPGGVNEAKGILKVMSDIGGSEGLAGLQQRAQQLDQLADLAAKNPSAVLDEIAQIAPGQMSAVAGKAISMWMQEDPDGYTAAVSGLTAQMLANIDFNPNMKLALTLLSKGHSEDAMSVLTEMQGQIAKFGQAASAPSKPRANTPDPNDTRAKELDTREASMFDNSLAQAMISYRDPMIFKEAEQWTKGMTLTDRQKSSLVRDVTAEIGATAQKDGKWLAEYQAAVKSKNQDAALRLYQEKAGKIGPEIVKNVSRELFGSPVSATRAPKPVVAAKPAQPRQPLPTKKADAFDAIWNQ